MKLHIFTIVLDGMRFLPAQFYTFNRLNLDWHWHIAHGAAANVNCTRWCRAQEPSLSSDGTAEYLQLLAEHPRISVHNRPLWEQGKVEMVNACIQEITDPCILFEVDADELWTTEQVEHIYRMLGNSETANCARFRCNYFVGPNVVTVGDNCYGNNPGEWLRAWRYQPGMRFLTHEPPFLSGVNGTQEICIPRDNEVGPFMHYAYTYPEQVAYKEKFYGYKNALAQWCVLQLNDQWPVTRLKNFLPWVDDRVGADLWTKPQH